MRYNPVETAFLWFGCLVCYLCLLAAERVTGENLME